MSVSKAFLPLLASLALTPAAMAAQAATPAVPAAAVPTPDAPVRAAVAEFVAALNAFDAQRLGRAFAEDATIFFPGAPFPVARVQGRATIQNAFGQLFAALRQRGTRQANIVPRGLDVQLLGDTAVATFHIAGAGQEIGRRTLVLRRAAGRWLIVHMHGSAAPIQARPAPPVPAARPAPTPPPPRR